MKKIFLHRRIAMSKSKVLKIGPGYINQVDEVLGGINVCGKILYVTDPVVDNLFGGTVRPQLEKLGRLKTEYVDNNTIAYAMSVAERVIATDVDYIVGLGGGKVLDVCKYASYVSKKPVVSIATTMANDGIASPIAVLKRMDGKPKSLGCATPSVLLLDTELIHNSPRQLIKAGIGDTISNYMALLDWELACQKGEDRMNGYAYLMSQTSLDALMKTQYDKICPEFIEVLANSLVLSGIAMDFAGSSRPVSGSEHLFSHALDYYCEKPSLHGIQVALGTVAVLKLIGRDHQDVVDYLNRFEVDINPQHLGIDEATFINCMQKATSMRGGRYTYLHEIDLNPSKLAQIYNELLEEV